MENWKGRNFESPVGNFNCCWAIATPSMSTWNYNFEIDFFDFQIFLLMTLILWRPLCLLSPILLLISSYYIVLLFYSQCSSGTGCRHRNWEKGTIFQYILKATLCALCFAYYKTLIITQTRFGIQWCHLQCVQLIIVLSSQHVRMVISSKWC